MVSPSGIKQRISEHGVLLSFGACSKDTVKHSRNCLPQKIKAALMSGLLGTFVVPRVSRVYLGGGVVVAGLVPLAGAAGLVVVVAGLLVTGRAGAGTPDCVL